MSTLLALLLGVPVAGTPGCGWGPDAEAPNPPPGDGPGAFLYEEGTIHDFELAVSDEAIHDLRRDGDDVRAMLTYSGVSWEVGLKLKGSSSYQGMSQKPAFKIDFAEWVPKQDMLGVRRLTLNNMRWDETMLREHVAYHLYEAVGVPAPRHGYARVWVNGDPYGLYGIVETLDERWLRRMFPGDGHGNLYDSVFTGGDLTGFGVSNFELKEGHPEVPYADLRELVADVDRMGINEVLEQRFDKDSVLSMWAVDLLTGMWDGYSRNTNNYLLYHATLTDRWYFIPWGQDTAFNGGGSLFLGIKGRLVAACVNNSQCRGELEDKAREALDTWETLDLETYAEDTWASIGDACEADPRKESDCDPWDLFEMVEDRFESMRRELP